MAVERYEEMQEMMVAGDTDERWGCLILGWPVASRKLLLYHAAQIVRRDRVR